MKTAVCCVNAGGVSETSELPWWRYGTTETIACKQAGLEIFSFPWMCCVKWCQQIMPGEYVTVSPQGVSAVASCTGGTARLLAPGPSLISPHRCVLTSCETDPVPVPWIKSWPGDETPTRCPHSSHGMARPATELVCKCSAM